MTPDRSLQEAQLDALRRLDTRTVSNAVETFDVRLRHTGFADARIHCIFKDLAPIVGYAATARLRTIDPPIAGRTYHDRADWWNSILQVPPPRVAVLQDEDEPPGVGALLGDMHAAILRALGCVAYVTNGAVRELPRVRNLGLQLFAGNVAVSHAYAHIFDFGSEIHIGGLQVRQGDLLHGDRQGLLTVLSGIAAQIPAAASRFEQGEQRIIDFCGSSEFSVSGLRDLIEKLQ